METLNGFSIRHLNGSITLGNHIASPVEVAEIGTVLQGGTICDNRGIARDAFQEIVLSRNSFLIWLVTLGSAASTLLWLLHSGGSAEYSPIGGGGYDLGGFIYSWALLILTGLWTVIAFLIGMGVSDRSSSRRAFILSGWGTLAMLLTLWLHASDLS